MTKKKDSARDRFTWGADDLVLVEPAPTPPPKKPKPKAK